jgi:hypothetical protein
MCGINPQAYLAVVLNLIVADRVISVRVSRWPRFLVWGSDVARATVLTIAPQNR